MLQTNRRLGTLGLGSNRLLLRPLESVRHLSAGLALNTALWRLELDRASLGTEGAVVLAEGLARNTGLVYLDVSHNEIEDRGAAALAAATAHHPSLRVLIVSQNTDVGDLFAAALGEALKTNKVLHSVQGVYCLGVTQAGFDQLQPSAAAHPRLRRIEIGKWDNKLRGYSELTALTTRRPDAADFKDKWTVATHSSMPERSKAVVRAVALSCMALRMRRKEPTDHWLPSEMWRQVLMNITVGDLGWTTKKLWDIPYPLTWETPRKPPT